MIRILNKIKRDVTSKIFRGRNIKSTVKFYQGPEFYLPPETKSNCFIWGQSYTNI